MGIYSIHLKPGVAAELAANPDRLGDSVFAGAIIIREGFSWPAFVFGPLWLLWHRLWLALVLYALFLAIVWGLPWLDDFVSTNPLVVIAAHLFLGVEAHSLREWKLGRSGVRLAGVVYARGIDEAARRFFKRTLNGGAERRPISPLGTSRFSQRKGAFSGDHDVLGLFSGPEL